MSVKRNPKRPLRVTRSSEGVRRVELKLINWPTKPWLIAAGLSIYSNFFLARTLGDVRIWIMAVIVAVFLRCKVEFTTGKSFNELVCDLLRIAVDDRQARLQEAWDCADRLHLRLDGSMPSREERNVRC